jgi:hypothetical protein
MRPALWRISRANLGDPHAGLGHGPATWPSSLVPRAPVPGGRDTGYGLVGETCLLPPRLTLLGVRLVVLCWAVILAPTTVAGHPAGSREFHPDGPGRVASPGHVQPGSPEKAGRFGGVHVLRHCKRSHAFPRFSSDSDPFDDETSDDPNDDILWDDSDDRDDAGVPVVACVFVTVSDVLLPSEVESAPDPPEPTSSPILTTRRLRC